MAVVVRARPAGPVAAVRRSPWVPRPGGVGAVAVAGVAGVALLLAFPPFDLWWLAPVGVALLALACHGRGVAAGAGCGAVCGAVFFGVLLRWTNTQAGAMPWLLLSGLQACYVALLGAATAWVGPLVVRRPGWWAPVTGLLWVGQEGLRDRTPFGGFPWARLAFSQADSPLLGLAAVGGAPLVSFAVALSGGFLAVGVVGGWSVCRTARAAVPDGAGWWAGVPPVVTRLGRWAVPPVASAAVVLLVAVVVMVGGLAVSPREPSGTAVTVAIVQGSVPRLGLEFNAQRRAVLDNHVEGTLRLAAQVRSGEVARPDLVIWPENSSDIDPLRNPDAAARISVAADAVGVPILVGTLLHSAGGGNTLNTGLVWHPGSGPGERYVKRHPVPFAEYVPFRSLARKVTDKVDLVRSDFVAGDRPGVLTLGPARVGLVICFEIAYDDVVRDTITEGGQLLVVQTNNATFNSDEANQQLAMVRLRAVEHGRHALMASTVGISGFVDAHGRRYGATSFFSPAVVVRELRLGDGRTVATRLGPAPEYLLLAGVVVALLVAAAIRRSPAVKEDT